MPTKAIFLLPSFKSYSNSEWMTFNGLFFECSARPISSKKNIEITFLFFLFAFSKDFLALSKTDLTPSEVELKEPWYELTIILGSLLKSLLSDNSSPFIDFDNNWTLNDLLHPGFPTINKGTLAFMQTNKANIFSKRALFFAIPSFISMLSTIYFSSFFGNSSKLNPKILFIRDENSFR